MSTTSAPSAGLHDLTLEEWLTSTAEKREALFAYAKSEPPIDQDEAIQNEAEAAILRADAEWYLTQETARQTLLVAKEYDALSADERRVMVKAKVADIKRLVDSLAVVVQTIKSRVYSAMNQNRSRP
jgi:hypothetical protein